MRRALVAPEVPGKVVEAVAAAATHIVTLTVTEKGYHRAADGGLALALRQIWSEARDQGIVTALFGPQGRFKEWSASGREIAELQGALAQLETE